MKPTVLYIDEEEMALRTMGKRLRRCFSDQVNVVTILPARSLEMMIDVIRSYDDLISVVIDQKLFAAGTATYVGTELAVAIRQTDRMMPIYILTNFVDDVDKNLGDIEYVLAKDDISDNEKIVAISARLSRHVNIFTKILNDRELRFETLLRKGFEFTLSPSEAEEFNDLKFHRERKIALSEMLAGVDLGQRLDEAEKRLAEISRNLNR